MLEWIANGLYWCVSSVQLSLKKEYKTKPQQKPKQNHQKAKQHDFFFINHEICRSHRSRDHVICRTLLVLLLSQPYSHISAWNSLIRTLLLMFPCYCADGTNSSLFCLQALHWRKSGRHLDLNWTMLISRWKWRKMLCSLHLLRYLEICFLMLGRIRKTEDCNWYYINNFLARILLWSKTCSVIGLWNEICCFKEGVVRSRVGECFLVAQQFNTV